MIIGAAIAVAIFTCGIVVDAKLYKNDILLLNKPLNVGVGRSVWLDPINLLRINVRSGDTCIISVIDNNEELYYTPGRLSKPEFSCNFGPEEIKYIHYGGSGYMEDRVQLLLRYDSHTENQTVIIPFSMSVYIHNSTSEIISHGYELTIDRHMGFSAPIDPQVLKFSYDESVSQCVIRVIPTAGLPQYGQLLNSTNPLTTVECDMFLTLGIIYKHNAEANSANVDFIPMNVKILQKDGELIQEEYFQLQVNIAAGRANTPPKPSDIANFIMYSINQFGMTAITPDVVSATDAETPSDRLLFKITFPLGPGEGHIINTDNINMPITSFYQHDINNWKIAYKPPSSDSSIQRMVQLGLTIFDPQGLASAPIQLMIIVKPRNMYAPFVSTNTGIQVFRGSATNLSLTILDISDVDNLEAVEISHRHGMSSGHLALPPLKTYFTYEDLRKGRVQYVHDGDETSSCSDNVVFSMTDGTHEVEFLFPVTIYPVDRQAPAVIVNADLHVQKHGVVGITSHVLSAMDDDTDDAFITFRLAKPFSTQSVIIKRQFEMPFHSQDWQFNDGIYEQTITSFTQKDIYKGKIFFKYVGAQNLNIVLERFNFYLTDHGNPPNRSPLYTFTVKVHPLDDVPPYLNPNTVLQLEVNDSTQLTQIKRKNLRYSDNGTSDRDILYIIRKQPFDAHDHFAVDTGFVVDCVNPYRRIYRFKQTELNLQKICYQPPKAISRLTTQLYQFWFDVEDQAGNRLENQHLNIIMKPVNSQPPLVCSAGATVSVGGRIYINTQLLHLSTDRELYRLNLRLLTVPGYGILYNNGHIVTEGSAFKYEDIVENRIVYYQNTRENLGNTEGKTSRFVDDFVVEISDKAHHIPVTMRITVGEDDSHTVHKNASRFAWTHNLYVAEGERTQVAMQMVDPYSYEDNVLCSIMEQPQYGFLENRGSKFQGIGVPVSSFSYLDIKSGLIFYVQSIHKGIEPTQDQFKIQCCYGDTSSDLSLVSVAIQNKNDEVPSVVVRPFRLYEGADIVIDTSVINAEDDQSEDELIIVITRQPEHGAVVQKASQGNVPVHNFTLEDIKVSSPIYYIHDDSESRTDSFEFVLTDGIHETRKIVQINILPVDDKPPRLAANDGLIIDNIKETKLLTNDNLKAEDRDSEIDNITFIIERAPKFGYLTKMSYGSGMNMTYITNFTQSDIDNNMIHYTHTGTEAVRDMFLFHVTDGINTLRSKTFQITVKGLDVIYPEVVSQAVQLQADGTSKLTMDIFVNMDKNLPDEKIKFTVSKPPFHGHVEYIDWPGMPVEEFSLKDVKANNVRYTHETEDEIKVDFFELEVNNGSDNVRHTYRIALTAIDNKIPVVLFSSLRLEEGANKVISLRELKAIDIDTIDKQIIFTITQVPLHGNLLYNHSCIVTQFSQKDLKNKMISYQQDGTETMSDSFIFTVTDGDHFQFFVPGSSIPTRQPQEMDIVIIPVDSGIPHLKVNTGAVTLTPVDIGIGFTLTNSHLQCEDKDSVVKNIRYTMSIPPKHGFICNIHDRGLVVLQWTQGTLFFDLSNHV